MSTKAKSGSEETASKSESKQGATTSGVFSVEEVMNTGPPPDLLRRQLVFDSLSKIIDNKSFNRSLARGILLYQSSMLLEQRNRLV